CQQHSNWPQLTL
nr:immunoglobulin light chain junction region [Macaca mulatta]